MFCMLMSFSVIFLSTVYLLDFCEDSLSLSHANLLANTNFVFVPGYIVDCVFTVHSIQCTIHCFKQREMPQIQASRDKVSEYRDDSTRLDQCNHFDDLSLFSFTQLVGTRKIEALRCTQQTVYGAGIVQWRLDSSARHKASTAASIACGSKATFMLLMQDSWQ